MSVLPALGWTYLSRKDIQRAEAQLQPESEGVRDEIGFLAVHQAYADRLFPGTSVLHTRLRYVLFVPWLFQRLTQNPSGESPSRRLQEEERKLAGRLKASREDGVIGGRVHPNPSASPPSMVYWTALHTWGLMIPRPDGTLPSRSSALRSVDANRRSGARAFDDDRQSLGETRHLFVTVPAPPKEWDAKSDALSFRMTREEQQFVRTRLGAVSRRDGSGNLSLIARLAESGVDFRDIEQPWMRAVRDIADKEDRAALTRARQAASLAAVGRAVYAALVEEWRDQKDRQPTPNVHRKWLQEMVRKHRSDALALDLDGLKADEPKLAVDPISNVLGATQHWLKGAKSFKTLIDIYADTEQRRKGVRRARLGTAVVNLERRLEWDADQHPLAQPLHYRWPQVRRLLLDLKGVA